VYFQTIDVVVSTIETIRQVSADMKEVWRLLPLCKLNRSDPFNVSSRLKDVEENSIKVLCDLEILADDVDARWRPINDDWHTLPECDDPSTTAATTGSSVTASHEHQPRLALAISLIDMLRSLKSGRCTADIVRTSMRDEKFRRRE